MAHQIPHQLPVHDDRRLPNGAKVDFGNTRKPKLKPLKPKPKKQAPPSKKKATPIATSDSYAGSSFHLSPEAMALPKPTFKSTLSPPPNPVTAYPAGSVPTTPSMYTQPMMAQQLPMMMGQSHMMMPMPPPMMPPNIHPGFTYQVNPQGYIVYPQPGAGAAPPMGNHGPITTHFQQPMQFPPQHQPQHQLMMQPQGQKISFNDLIESLK